MENMSSSFAMKSSISIAIDLGETVLIVEEDAHTRGKGSFPEHEIVWLELTTQPPPSSLQNMDI